MAEAPGRHEASVKNESSSQGPWNKDLFKHVEKKTPVFELVTRKDWTERNCSLLKVFVDFLVNKLRGRFLMLTHADSLCVIICLCHSMNMFLPSGL